MMISLESKHSSSTNEGRNTNSLNKEGLSNAPTKFQSDENSTRYTSSNVLDTNYSSSNGLRRNSTFVWASGRPNVNVVVTGVSAALPGRHSNVFSTDCDNILRIINGENFITDIPDHIKDNMLEKNVKLLQKNKETGINTKIPITKHEETINLCASLGDFDLTSYGVSQSIASTMDVSVQVAVAAGLEALKDAGIVSGIGTDLSRWELPQSMQDTTGIVYATSFPALDTAIAEVTKYFESKLIQEQNIPFIINHLRERLQKSLNDGEVLSKGTENALKELSDFTLEISKESQNNSDNNSKLYEFDRKFLFRVLVLGNAQLAQIIKARGPNMQTNAACAGSTQAVALAFDMIQVGRAERMIVIAGDNAASDTLMPWLGNGFRALGAATISNKITDAAIPFNGRRRGMILGAGGIGMVLESEEGARRRYSMTLNSERNNDTMLNDPTSITTPRKSPFRCRLLGTLFSNSAYHGASMDKEHIAKEMERFISSVEQEQGITREMIALNGVYFSHETSTYASSTSSCASNELYGLRKVFGKHFKDLIILNTKGFTGHPMGVSFEDVVATEVLVSGRVPPIANYVEGEDDEYLGSDLNLSRGGTHKVQYAIRFAAGFGSQIALALYGSARTGTSTFT
jgi:3-oxoacyl-(acyl-carrier-protein) synthase